ncbi:MAG: hypothetical protein RLO52_04560 [Sandaracinaceae bacterium]
MRSTCTMIFAVNLCFALAAGCSCSDVVGEVDDAATPRPDAGVDGMDAARPFDGSPTDADVTPTDGGADARVTDAGPACRRGFSLCDGACIFTAADPRNCGGCGAACAAGEACVSSGCTDTCPPPLTLCGDRCVDLRSDSAHCDACDSPCASGTGCSDGRCVDVIPVGPGPTDCADGRPLELFTPDGARCSGRIAALSFTHALCACHDVGGLSAPALFDAFDSTRGPYVPGLPGGSVGANGTVGSSSRFTATGDLRVAGASGFQAGSGRYAITQALRVASAFEGRGNTVVDGDGYIGGPFDRGGATFGGDLYTPSCAAVPADVVAASCIEGPVSVPPPCACAPADILPIGAMIDHYADPAANDDALIGLDPDALAAPAGPVRLDLPCGRYYLSAIRASRPVTIAVHGNAALFIGGDVDVSAALLLAVDPGATLDVFVGGQLTDSGSLSIGSPAYPAATRFYVDGPCHHEGAACVDGAECCGGTCSGGVCGPDPARPPDPAVRLSVRADMNGLFYAPNGPVEVSAPLEMYGAIFAYSYDASSDTTIHYDLQATRLADDCPTTPGPSPDAGVPDGGGPGGCGSCRDCDNQACIDGACGDCRNDADCCSPLYCVRGRCVSGPD